GIFIGHQIVPTGFGQAGDTFSLHIFGTLADFSQPDQYFFRVASAIGAGAAIFSIIGTGHIPTGLGTCRCHIFSAGAGADNKNVKFFYSHKKRVLEVSRWYRPRLHQREGWRHWWPMIAGWPHRPPDWPLPADRQSA